MAYDNQVQQIKNRECESTVCRGITGNLRRVVFRVGGWGQSHSGYQVRPVWICEKCRCRLLGQWKYFATEAIDKRRIVQVAEKEAKD